MNKNIISNKPKDFFDLITKLQTFWSDKGCSVVMPYFNEVGAGTFHPLTVLRAIDDKPANFAYVQGCSRPSDGRYAQSPNRLQYYYQFQVIFKPSPDNIVDLYLESLRYLGINTNLHDIRFVEDDWESPSLGAFGLGWEVWCDGMEITQFTYFQQVAGFTPSLAPVEITYGLERIMMYILDIDNVYELPWHIDSKTTYGDIIKQSEQEFCSYNFEYANIENLLVQFKMAEEECELLVSKNLAFPAYNLATKASHYFNLLDARGALGVNERALYIQKIQNLVKKCADIYIKGNK
ncbi:glycine--tRNA ligase subunit alpha [Rickettsiales bacterium LUAb2]